MKHELDIFRFNYDIGDFTYPLTNIEMERMLSKIKLSASGCDGIPAWLLRECSYELADIVAHILLTVRLSVARFRLIG